jgi:hypothetical protein
LTCIVGLVAQEGDKPVIYMGGDSASVDSYFNIYDSKYKKVFIKGDLIIGFTSSWRMGQLLQYKLDVGPINIWDNKKYNFVQKDVFEYMVTDFVKATRECLKDGGYARIENNEESGGCFLVGCKGRLFQVACDFQVGESLLPYMAVGCGRDYALGSLYSTEGLLPEERITKALQAAQQFSAGVREPFYILKGGM